MWSDQVCGHLIKILKLDGELSPESPINASICRYIQVNKGLSGTCEANKTTGTA